MEQTERKVIYWAIEKNIALPSNMKNQALKLASEAGEVCDEVLKGNEQAINNEIGDVLVVCSILAHQNGTDLETCLKLAYDKISKRKTITVNGTAIKVEDLTNDELTELTRLSTHGKKIKHV